MLERITRASVASRLAIVGFVSNLAEKAKDDRGQGSVEYVGIIIVVVAIVAIVLGASTDVGNTIKDKIIEEVQKLGQSK